MKILVTGSEGLIGSQVVKDLLFLKHEIIGTYHNLKPKFGTPHHLDLTDLNAVKQIIRAEKPEVIIHLAAMTDVDQCEKYPKIAHLINSESTKVIAHEASSIDCFLIYVSTDYVFDTNKGLHKEEDIPKPLGVYGKSKLEGEIFLQDLQNSWCIARTSTPYGIHPKKTTFPLFVIQQLQQHNVINAIEDQFTSPTYVPNLSKMLIEISQKKITGIIHTAGATRISRFDTALYLGEKLNLDTSLIKPIKLADMNRRAPRPNDSSLDVSKATSILKEKPLDIYTGLNSFISNIDLKI